MAAALLALAAGAAAAFQVAVQSRLGQRVGLLPATLFSVSVSTTIALLVLLAVHRSLGGFLRTFQQTPVLWIGGALGVVVVFTFAFGGPRIGTAATIGFYIAGTLVTTAVIDRFGILGLHRIPLSPTRLAGLLLLGLGAFLTLRR